MCIRDRLQVQLLCLVHAGGQSSACHPLQAHLVLETASCFRLILYWKRLRLFKPVDFFYHTGARTFSTRGVGLSSSGVMFQCHRSAQTLSSELWTRKLSLAS